METTHEQTHHLLSIPPHSFLEIRATHASRLPNESAEETKASDHKQGNEPARVLGNYWVTTVCSLWAIDQAADEREGHLEKESYFTYKETKSEAIAVHNDQRQRQF